MNPAIPSRPTRRAGPDAGEPTVFVSDEQDGHPVDLERWGALAAAVLRDCGVEGEAELSVIFVDEGHMTDLNVQYMQGSGPTDVLSFPIDGPVEPTTNGLTPPGLTPAARADFDVDDQPLLLGDVVVCPAVAARQAPEHAGTYDDEVALLVVHGVLHVLGMDHATDDERIAMQGRERELLGTHHGPLARDPWAS